MLVIFLLTITLGISFVFISQQDERTPQERKTTKDTGSDSDYNLSPLPERSNRKAIHFGVSISKTGRFRVEGCNVIEGYNLWQEHLQILGCSGHSSACQ